MALNMVKNKALNYALRALQLIFSIIIKGTDGYASYPCVSVILIMYVHFEFGNFHAYYGVPNAFADRALIGYIRVAVEAVAVLSWLAGFITMAVQIATDTCSTGISSCGLLKVATVYGAFEWLLFMITAAQTVILWRT
ncbi:MARVEL domain-containing protein [Histoplasma capsulatum]|uniref:MARVEL domain-containing protein n=1 Tax=Ajellomyces capsulatus TaxID=5037 RepID=A0A8A1M9Q4_AJECA|nr:MARVEL domain-containing protein [Histoplasma capsulatum]